LCKAPLGASFRYITVPKTFRLMEFRECMQSLQCESVSLVVSLGNDIRARILSLSKLTMCEYTSKRILCENTSTVMYGRLVNRFALPCFHRRENLKALFAPAASAKPYPSFKARKARTHTMKMIRWLLHKTLNIDEK